MHGLPFHRFSYYYSTLSQEIIPKLFVDENKSEFDLAFTALINGELGRAEKMLVVMPDLVKQQIKPVVKIFIYQWIWVMIHFSFWLVGRKFIPCACHGGNSQF